jgi:anthranilate synthase component 2
MKKILIIDNYDSFVYNIVQLLKETTECEVDVVMNDKVPFYKLCEYKHIILSPGPGLPGESGDLLKVIETCKLSSSILGICLGHQAIACHFGAKLLKLSQPLHGHASTISITYNSDPIIGRIGQSREIASPLIAGLYNSWVVDPLSLPQELSCGSVNERGEIMSIFHKELPFFGVQFHPESIISTRGEDIMKNWLSI